ncbi:winged helix-turn-helix domain-containing protein [Lysobacter capsici]|jgi:DNA-binding response OmpR family regulator|uniref:response regulator transcription factor n=1 Tax=Lysobacter capsici TaxID=435897 RepID=UPI000699BBAF|nr:winged helix-turn-helix domain-containing protein [Lysobacter capsici]ALN85406.1 transcriptional regulatory, C terminal family protein [Lysobacter capsici]UOF16869.1 winged helix-turn-helix domain-containing protein [Lysobacter capsici]WND82566.1 winged helix-turn-helix domain-containing protein [Lysobacter capsici]WND87762.1 winged helix-turn-helix domain-containing protein [Lysobacter capsici]
MAAISAFQASSSTSSGAAGADNRNARRIAVVERDPDLRQQILHSLQTRQFAIVECANATALYRNLLTAPCDIAVIASDLPDDNPRSVALHLRQHSDIGIIVLDAEAGCHGEADSYHEIADACFAKPVDLDGLAAVVTAMHSLQHHMRAMPARAGAGQPEWELALDGWTLRTPEGASIDLSAPERNVLLRLVNTGAGGHPVSHDSLIGSLTSDVYDFDPHRLEMLIYRLRKKVALMSPLPLPLRAVRGMGYLCTIVRSNN